MKVIIEGTAHFPRELSHLASDGREEKIEIVGYPDEDLDHGSILLVHKDVSLELSHSDLVRALRVFEGK